MNALQHLCQLADQHKAERSPNFLAKYIPENKYSNQDNNGLTCCIVDYLNCSGHFATRIATTATYRGHLQRFVDRQQLAAMPDVLAIIKGRYLFITIEERKDALSEVLTQAHKEPQQASRLLYVAHSFQGFYDWFTGLK